MARKKSTPPASVQTDQRASLFARVKQEPDDDALRLVLADWLDDHGDEDDRTHAELIRVQCEVLSRSASLIDPERPGPINVLLRSAEYHNSTLRYEFQMLTDPDPRLVALRLREVELTRRWCDGSRPIRWVGELSALPVQHSCHWHRGFASLRLQYEPFRSRDLATLAASLMGPRVEQLDLNVSPSNSATIARNTLLAQTVGLAVSGQKFGAAELATLLTSPQLAGLRRLDVGLHARIDKMEAIARAPGVARLTHLYLYSNRLNPAQLGTLAAAELPALQALHAGGSSEMGAQGARSLAAAPFLAHLQELILTNSKIEANGMEALVSGPHFRCPSLLEVGLNNVGPAGLRALLAAPGLENLVVLEANENALDDTAVAELAGSPRLGGLLGLDLRLNPGIGPAGAEALAGSPHLARLASLNLRGCSISESGARALLNSSHLRRLQLTISEEGISPATLSALRERYLVKK